jgi:3'(2'), 5'-bisphosphate nucleotidase
MWDSCGPAAILMAAGGMMTDMAGAALNYSAVDVRHRQGLLASHGRLHELIVKTLESEGVKAEG